jgi:omega-amidase
MIAKKLKLHLIQFDTIWKDAAKNCTEIEKVINTAPEADIHILPETFNTGFAIDKTLAETMDGPTVNWMLSVAKKHQSVVCGSLLIRSSRKTFNRFIWAQPNGELFSYDKRHLFSLAKEETQFDKGNKQIIISYLGWNIRPLVCYDLRFPVWSRNDENTDLMIYVANWPKPRIEAWKVLLRARAIENQCFVVGVNRTGTDPSGMTYTGQSAVISPMGDTLCALQENVTAMCIEIDYTQLETIREKISFQKDRDSFSID